MSKTRYQYLGEDYTLIRPSTGAPKEKVVQGEIIEIEDGLYDKGRLIMGGFRKVIGKGENMTVVEAGNDAVVRENAEKAEAERIAKEEAEANAQDNTKGDGGVVADGLGAPVIEVPGSTPVVTTTTEEDGKSDITVEVQNTTPTVTPVDYTTLKQPELKAELEKRGLPVPAGIVANAALIEALVADDKAKAEANAQA